MKAGFGGGVCLGLDRFRERWRLCGPGFAGCCVDLSRLYVMEWNKSCSLLCAPMVSGSEYAVAAYAIDAESSSALCSGATKPEFMVAVFVIASTFLLLCGLRCYLVPVVGLECFFNCLEHWQVKTLCEKAKEILMEESNVQVRQISQLLS